VFAGIDPLNGRCQVSRIGGDGSKRLVIVQRLRLIGGSEEFPVEDAKLVKHHPHGIRRIAAVVPARPNEHRRLVDEDTRFEGVFIELLVLFLKKTVERLGLAWCNHPDKCRQQQHKHGVWLAVKKRVYAKQDKKG